jgi:hypothetical protein
MKVQNQRCSELCNIEEEESISIFLTTPQSTQKRVTVNKHASVSTLLSLVPLGKKTVFSEGSVVDQKKTFEELNIRSHSRVVIINGENLTFDQEMFWKRVTKSDAELTERLQLMDNQIVKRELSRIVDLRMMRIEDKTNNVKRMIRMNWMMRREESEEQQMSTVTEYEKRVSETALPMLW